MLFKKYTNRNGYYLYFPFSGNIIRSDKEFITKLSNIETIDDKEFHLEWQRLLEENKQTGEYDFFIQSPDNYVPNGITFSITEKCNLACKYCVFSEDYQDTRNETMQNLTWEDAKNAIDYMLESDEEAFYIGFYGGEPLLRFDLIKRIVDYCNRSTKTVNWGMTTNGVLLNQEVSDFLVKNNFVLTVSLDGIKEYHDKNRVLKDGSPTWDIVWKNLAYLKEQYPEYCDEKLELAAVAEDRDVYFRILQEREKLGFKIEVSEMIPYNIEGYKEKYDKDKNTDKIKHSLMLSFTDKFYENFQNNQLDKDDSNALFRMRTFHKRGAKEKVAFRSCFPGDTKHFIKADGTKYICEKVEHTFCIGSKDEFVNPAKCREVVEKWIKFREDTCRNCWAVHLCDACYQHFAKDNEFVKNEYFCMAKRDEIEGRLQVYTALLEKFGKDRLDHYYKTGSTIIDE